MGTIYDRNSVTVVMVKDMLGLRKTIEADYKDCPDMIFTHTEAESLFKTLQGSGFAIAGASLALFGERMNAKGTYPEQMAAAVQTERVSTRTGETYMRNDAWSNAQLKAFKPSLYRLEVGFYGGPQLCAYMVAPPSRAGGGKARVIPAINRIDVSSPEGKAIAERHESPRTARIPRR